MQYTLQNVPKHLDPAIRQRAKEVGKSLNEVTVEALLEAFDLSSKPIRRRDLSAFAGSWREDEETEQVLREQRQIDPLGNSHS